MAKFFVLGFGVGFYIFALINLIFDTELAHASTDLAGSVFATTWSSSITGASNYSPSSGYVFFYTPSVDIELEKISIPYTRHPSGNCTGSPVALMSVYEGAVDGSTFGTLIATTSVACSSLFVQDGSVHTNSFPTIARDFNFASQTLTGGTQYAVFIHSTGGLYMRYHAPSTGGAPYYHRLANSGTPDWDTTNRSIAYIVQYTPIAGDSTTHYVTIPDMQGTTTCEHTGTSTNCYSETTPEYNPSEIVYFIFFMFALWFAIFIFYFAFLKTQKKQRN